MKNDLTDREIVAYIAYVNEDGQVEEAYALVDPKPIMNEELNNDITFTIEELPRRPHIPNKEDFYGKAYTSDGGICTR